MTSSRKSHDTTSVAFGSQIKIHDQITQVYFQAISQAIHKAQLKPPKGLVQFAVRDLVERSSSFFEIPTQLVTAGCFQNFFIEREFDHERDFQLLVYKKKEQLASITYSSQKQDLLGHKWAALYFCESFDELNGECFYGEATTLLKKVKSHDLPKLLQSGEMLKKVVSDFIETKRWTRCYL